MPACRFDKDIIHSNTKPAEPAISAGFLSRIPPLTPALSPEGRGRGGIDSLAPLAGRGRG
ncbi:hypothetical protein DES42_10688 [Zavarzinia compransoris]|nr:hypothetical protein DES42_10688 [Zavarzinia compransoris]